MQRTLIEIQTELDRSNQRRRDAEHGTLLLDDGTDAAIAARDLDEARILLSQTESDIVVAKVDIASARNLLAAAKGIYETTRRIEVQAPPGALVWSLITAPGAAVQPGAPVASWIDCSDMLVDVPVSDVELALLTKGAPANVILEGEQKIRRGTILLTPAPPPPSARTISRRSPRAATRGSARRWSGSSRRRRMSRPAPSARPPMSISPRSG